MLKTNRQLLAEFRSKILRSISAVLKKPTKSQYIPGLAWILAQAWWEPTMFEDKDEVDPHELYETEYELRDILPKDGWIPHED
jgi:hypothetical protein